MNRQHVITTAQFFDRAVLERLFRLASEMERQVKAHRVERRLQGYVMAALFYEPSTRTRFSFEAAMHRLGGSVISSEAAGQFSSALKGESLEDSIRVTGGYADLIVLRHPEVGSAERAAAVSSVPIINAGDGGGEHPTQALLDVFTIQQELGRIDGLKLALVGDLRHSRSMHSLLFLLGLYDIELLLVAPKQLQLTETYRRYLKANKVRYSCAESLEALDKSLDIVYMNRIQKERFDDPGEYERLKDYLTFRLKNLDQLKPAARVMDPLPRVGKIDLAVDQDPRAAYFRQAQNGLYLRMALLAEILPA
ncbi:MAG TPA: aspartate carbamoyltransferase [Candidatus Saccharimonadales bacterium]|nr:aspartate carbamoyltransferase [Candidatus Saccharimonadales bacterium]